MWIFHSAEDAKQFFVSRILQQARAEGISLSPLEQELLRAGGEDFELPDELMQGDEPSPELQKDLEELDPDEYEAKVIVLLRRAFAGDVEQARRLGEKHAQQSYRAAYERLRAEDHPLLRLADRALGKRLKRRTLKDFILLGASLLLVLYLVAVVSGLLPLIRSLAP